MRRLSKKPFGIDLCHEFMGIVAAGKPMFAYHPYYCGDGISCSPSGIVSWARYEDGQVMRIRKRWDDLNEFTEFLALQSDYTCAGHKDGHPWLLDPDIDFTFNNQRVNRRRITYHIKCHKDTSHA